MRLLSTMNNFHATKRYNSNERERTVPALSIDDGVNFVQEGEDEPEKAQEGAAFIQRGEAATPRAPPKKKPSVVGTPSRRRREIGGGTRGQGQGTNEAGQTSRPPSCQAIHMPSLRRTPRPLGECPNVTDEILGQMHVQSVAREEEIRREEDGSEGYVKG